MRIGLDLDGVIYQFDKTAQYMIARHRGLQAREELPWNHSQYWRGIDQADWDWLWESEQTDALFRHGHLYSGAIEGVHALAELGDLVVLTKRPPNAVKVTWDFLRYHFGDENYPWPFKEVHVLSNRAKHSVTPYCDIYVDDNVDVCEDLWLTTRKLVLLWDQPWNWDSNMQGPVRVSSWEAVIDWAQAFDFCYGRVV